MNATLAHDRSLRLFQFLREFTLLKAKPQRTSDNDTLLWLHSLPQEPEVQNAARREAQDTTPDVWLSVRKPKTTAPPILPDTLQPWVLARREVVEHGRVLKHTGAVDRVLQAFDDFHPVNLFTGVVFADEDQLSAVLGLKGEVGVGGNGAQGVADLGYEHRVSFGRGLRPHGCALWG